eukprot:10315523-Alexandrium_andersonii.AAC.1
MRVDSLHTLNLGAMLVFCRVSLWYFLDINTCKLAGSLGDRLALSVLRLRNDLMAYYDEHQRFGLPERTQ